MIRLFGRHESFGAKIVASVTLTSGLALLVVSFTLAIADYRDLRSETFETARSLTNLIALNSAAALAFGDRRSAAEALHVLRANPEVASATLYDREGKRFASYLRAPGGGPGAEFDATALVSGEAESGGRLSIAQPIADRGEELGSLALVYDLRAVNERLTRSVGISILVSLAAMLLVYFEARRIERGLVRPIDELLRTANRIAGTGEYSLRARRTTEDELGQLTQAFNEMLD
ncbi:MAG: CHASE sensor domain-containing protein, partial [Myxococcota bacterium]